MPGDPSAPRAPARPRRVSMHDVARRAGVSAQTVSRVSNGYPGVVESTRATVLSAMSELGYRPNSAARALKAGAFRTIGVVVFSLAGTGNTRTLEEIASSAATEGYAITLIPVAAPTRAGLHGAITRLGELAVDALIVIMEGHRLDGVAAFLPPGVPVAIADSGPRTEPSLARSATPATITVPRGALVDTDQTAGARSAVDHLLGLGHATVHHIAGPMSSSAATRRAEAWSRTLRAAGRPAPPPLRGDWSAASGYRCGLHLARDPSCTAVFAANDQMALGLLRALHEHGRHVPSDVSVVGFDDVDDAAHYQPPLTTVAQDFADVGRRLVRSVLDELRTGATRTGTDLVPTRLVVRASTAAPGSST